MERRDKDGEEKGEGENKEVRTRREETKRRKRRIKEDKVGEKAREARNGRKEEKEEGNKGGREGGARAEGGRGRGRGTLAAGGPSDVADFVPAPSVNHADNEAERLVYEVI